MTVFVREQERMGMLLAAAADGRRAVELARAQYGEGLADFQVVLDAERVFSGLVDDAARSEADVAAGLITLYKALGGGWDESASTESSPQQQE